jgi:hypothetical protein
LRVEAQCGFINIERQRLAQAEANRSLCFLTALRKRIEVQKGHAHGRIRQYRDHFLAIPTDGGQSTLNRLAERACILHVLRVHRGGQNSSLQGAEVHGLDCARLGLGASRNHALRSNFAGDVRQANCSFVFSH